MRFLLLAIVVVGLSLFGCSPPHQAVETPAEPAAPVETEMVAAEAGVGKEGQKLKGKEGVMITPIKALFIPSNAWLLNSKSNLPCGCTKLKRGIARKRKKNSWRRLSSSIKSNCQNYLRDMNTSTIRKKAS